MRECECVCVCVYILMIFMDEIPLDGHHTAIRRI